MVSVVAALPVPDSNQLPVPVFAIVRSTGLGTMLPANSPVPAVEPEKVSVLLPVPVKVMLLVNFSNPVPDWLSPPPPVVPARLITRSVVSPAAPV